MQAGMCRHVHGHVQAHMPTSSASQTLCSSRAQLFEHKDVAEEIPGLLIKLEIGKNQPTSHLHRDHRSAAPGRPWDDVRVCLSPVYIDSVKKTDSAEQRAPTQAARSSQEPARC